VPVDLDRPCLPVAPATASTENPMTDDEKLYFDAAVKHHLENAFQPAYDCYQHVLRSAPDNHHALHLSGVLMMQNGLIDLGRAAILRAIELRPDYLEAQYNLTVFDQSAALKVQREKESVPVIADYPTFDGSTVDAWRHFRMVDFAASFQDAGDTWLTVGDAHGHDAHMLKLAGIAHVTASNLETTNLQNGHALGQVGDYLQLNAEKLDLPDASYDYVLCKEALHHMPRPLLAIYEMLRVARKGVIFIEPQDRLIDWPLGKNMLAYRERMPSDSVGERVSFKFHADDQEICNNYIDWWEDGPFNYVYTLSNREIRKIALGMGLSSYATKNFNDFFVAEWAQQAGTEDSEGMLKTREQIALHDQACRATGKPYSYITGMLFKQSPSPELAQRLNAQGYVFTITPTRYLPIKWPQTDG
jgi:SAM-dependent methyltransferase